jgi:hypothetical protein
MSGVFFFLRDVHIGDRAVWSVVLRRFRRHRHSRFEENVSAAFDADGRRRGCAEVFDGGTVRFKFEIGVRRRAAARHREEVFLAFDAGVAVEEELRFDRLQLGFAERDRTELDGDFRRHVVDFEPLVEVAGGDAASGERRFGSPAHVSFEVEVDVFDERFYAFDVDAEQQRQVGFRFEVVDLAFERQHRPRQFQVGLQFDEAGLAARVAGVRFEFGARAFTVRSVPRAGERLRVGGEPWCDVDAQSLDRAAVRRFAVL